MILQFDNRQGEESHFEIERTVFDAGLLFLF